MGLRTSPSRASRRLAAARRTPALLAAAALALGCVPRAMAFEDWNSAWTAAVSDRTQSVASIHVLDAAGPGPELTGDSIRLRNVGPATVEVAWLGGSCIGTAHFDLSPEPEAVIGLRYDIGAPCAVPAVAGYALEICFRHPVDARSIVAFPAGGP